MSKRKLPSDEVLCDLYVNQNKNAGEIAKMYGVKYRGNVIVKLRKMGVEIRQDKGENHHNWKGGRTGKGDNYIGIWMPDHERADNQGYVYEHTLIAEKKYGRLPNKSEVVHHINLDKHNNDEDNLYLCDYIKHTKLHRSIDRMIRPLLEKGIIRFDEVLGEYIIN